MRLHSFVASPNPLKVRIALAELALPHEIAEVNLFRGEHRGDDFRKVNPHGKVPVLEDDGLVLRESGAILAHLGKTKGGAAWPTNGKDAARALSWLCFEATLQHAFGAIWWADRVSKAVGRPAAHDAILEDATDDLARALAVLEAELGGGWVLGDFTLVDCSLGVATTMLHETRLDDGRFPKTFDYARRFRERPSWRAANGDAILRFG